MNASVFIFIVPFFVLSTRLQKPVQGGICWTAMNKNGRCTDILSEKMTKEECCRLFTNINTAWSKDDMDSGSLFFMRVLGGGVPCYSCKESCAGVECGPGKKCVVRSGRPKCVCAPCKEKGRNSKGPVCGTDGNTYLNICRLKKRACRKKNRQLSVAYSGFCQIGEGSCERITCPNGKFCVLDQNLSPHCVRCSIRCPKTQDSTKPVCGSDGITYDNVCHLRQTACRKGKAIPVAYKGKCKAKATCGTIQCKENQSCLTELASGKPRCVTCDSKCNAAIGKELGGPLCGTNDKTYLSWCHMVKDACATGFVIETKFQGTCEAGEKRRSRQKSTITESYDNASSVLFSDMPDVQ